MLEFLDLKGEYSDLENGLITALERFILELGNGLMEWYRVDLLLFHAGGEPSALRRLARASSLTSG